tara:strand:+ start:436 stop:1029 length:594 start_codon:yes stop_codon:yes gene_type:complete
MKKVITWDDSLTKLCKEVSVEEGEKIATELFEILNKRKDGIGLAANQVGINKRVAVLNVKEPIVLINPMIVENNDVTQYYEGCLSFPKKSCNTTRYKYVVVECDNSESKLYFGPANDEDELGLLESICVQHEIDHLNGVRIMDREYKLKPVVRNRKFSRNEIVGITDGKDYKEIKYKKAKPLLDSGKWVVYVGGPIT